MPNFSSSWSKSPKVAMHFSVSFKAFYLLLQQMINKQDVFHIFLEVIGQNSFKVAGQVIIGISAAFLVWDAIDLGFTINDLVRKQGSKAARVLREKAAMLEGALDETLATYSVSLPD